MQFQALILTLALALLPAINAAPVEVEARQGGTIIPNPPNGQECNGASDGVTLGDIVGNLLGCGGVGGLLGGK